MKDLLDGGWEIVVQIQVYIPMDWMRIAALIVLQVAIFRNLLTVVGIRISDILRYHSFRFAGGRWTS